MSGQKMNEYFRSSSISSQTKFSLAFVVTGVFFVLVSKEDYIELTLAVLFSIESFTLLAISIYKNRNSIFCTVKLSNYSVKFSSLLTKPYTLTYKDFHRIGIAFSQKGGKEKYYIFFSPDKFDESYRCRIEQWKVTNGRLVIKFDKKLYKYLLTVLPPKQKLFLDMDYRMFIQKGNRKKRSFSKAEIARIRFKNAKRILYQTIRA